MKDSNALNLEELLQHDLKETGLKSIIDLVSHHSWWVSPRLYKEIQIVYPQNRRKKGINERRGMVVDGVMLWDNQPASYAFWSALGRNRNKVTNYYVCHVYEESVWDPHHYTNLANLTAFPKCLQSLSEWTPVRELLKYHSFKTYGYKGPKDVTPEYHEYYPLLWKNESGLNMQELERIMDKLKEQRQRRPQFRSNQNND